MEVEKLRQELSKVLGEITYSEHGVVGPLLAKLEETTKIKREHFVHGAISIVIAYLILGHSAELLCNVAGFIYPAYASIKAIESNDKVDDTQWLTYWTVFAFLSVIEFSSEQMVKWFPFYWLIKFIFLLWLYLPMTRGAEIVYAQFIVPLIEKYSAQLTKIQDEINQQLQQGETHSSQSLAADAPSVPNGDGALIPDLQTENENSSQKNDESSPDNADDGSKPEQAAVPNGPPQEDQNGQGPVFEIIKLHENDNLKEY